jgi:phytoene synthase
VTAVRSPTAAVEEGYRACEALTRARAANFYYGIRLLPGPKRRAMCAVYSFARRVDDIGDGNESPARKLALLAAVRSELAATNGSEAPDSPRSHLDTAAGDARALALADAERRFDLPRDALFDLLAGVEMDVRGESYATFEELVTYCRRVAGSIGRLSLAIFGTTDRALAEPLADDLGVAMQLTNILRDVREDLDRGRIYLPREDLNSFGCADLPRVPAEAFAALVAFQVGRARRWFDRGLRLLDLIDGRSGACVGAMTGIYRRILDRIGRDPAAVLERRVSLPPWEKTWVAVQSLKSAPGRAQANSGRPPQTAGVRR